MNAPQETLSPALAVVDQRAAAKTNPETVTAIMLLLATVLLIFGSKLISPALGSWEQVLTILTLGSFLLVAAFGQGLVILTGGLDLSVPGTFMLGGVLSAAWIGSGDVHLWFFLPTILLLGGVVGAANGLGVALLKVPPFIMTMGMSIIVGSIALGYTGGSTLGAAPTLLKALMKGDTLGVPNIVLLILGFSIAGWLLQSRTHFGRNLYAVGCSPAAARIAGIPITRTLVLVYALSGIASAFAGALLTGYSNGATLRMGDAYLLPTVAAVILGGASILGGSGSFINTFCGVLFLSTVESVIAATGLDQGWRLIISGTIIVLAILIQQAQASGARPGLSRLFKRSLGQPKS